MAWYRVLKPITRARDGKDFFPGEQVELELSELSEELLVDDRGVIEPLEAPEGARTDLTEIEGIGPERARGLREMGILSAADLVEVDATEVEAGMVNVSAEMVRAWQEQAAGEVEDGEV